jgi:nicotinamidase-related amidase
VSNLRFGPLSRRTVHLCVDMQNLFYEPTPWHTPWMGRVLPVILRLAERFPERTVFTRFIPPERPEAAHGAWRRYYTHWQELTREHVNPRLLELVPPLAKLSPPAAIVDKSVYSAFCAPGMEEALRAREADAVIVTGAETDVCVLASVLDAVDRGLRVVIAVDAICGSADETHDALMTLYNNRFGQQIETTTSERVLEAWPR